MNRRPVARYYLTCPRCDGDLGRVDRLFARTALDVASGTIPLRFGSWRCDGCGAAFRVRVASVDPPEVELIEVASETPGWLLVRVTATPDDDPLHFVLSFALPIEDADPRDALDRLRYLVEEHLCPSDLLRVEAVLAGTGLEYDDDPHGILRFVAWAPKSARGPDTAWDELFPELGAGVTIEADATLDLEPAVTTAIETALDAARARLLPPRLDR